MHVLSIRTNPHISMPRRDSPGFQVSMTKGACSFRVYLVLTVIYVRMILAAGADGTPACLNKYQVLSLRPHIIRSTPDLLDFTETIFASIHVNKAF